MPLDIATKAVQDFLNADYEFSNSALSWTTKVLLRVGDIDYVLTVTDGSVEQFGTATRATDVYSITISGSEDGWQKALSPLPPPYAQDLLGLRSRYGFDVNGDIESLYARYRALSRLLEAMRVTLNTKGLEQ